MCTWKRLQLHALICISACSRLVLLYSNCRENRISRLDICCSKKKYCHEKEHWKLYTFKMKNITVNSGSFQVPDRLERAVQYKNYRLRQNGTVRQMNDSILVILTCDIWWCYFSRILSSDPCVEGNYEIVAGQAQRSFNHHLSVGNLAPVCDSKLLQGWYR